MSTNNINELLEFCLNNTYFLFQDQFCEQTKGAAMGSPVCPIVANIYMEAFENRAISTALQPLRIWKRYVDDTSVIQHQSHRKDFFRHISSVDPSFKFTMEESKEDGSIPFLDAIVIPQPEWTFTIGYTDSPLAQIYTSHGIVIITFQQVVWLTSSHTELRPSSPFHNYNRKNCNIWQKYTCCVNIPSRP